MGSTLRLCLYLAHPPTHPPTHPRAHSLTLAHAHVQADNRGLVGDAQLAAAALLALQLEYQQGASEAVNREVTGAFRATAAAVAAVKGGRGDGCFVSFPADAVPGGVVSRPPPSFSPATSARSSRLAREELFTEGLSVP